MEHAEFRPEPGVPFVLETGLEMVLAPNPSPMTGLGTNTYLLGQKSLAVIDPGPLDKTHLKAVLAAIGDRHVSHIFVTHSHLDHSPLAAPLAQKVAAPVYAFGGALAGRSKVMQELAQSGMSGGGEGLDHDFKPDKYVSDGERLDGDGWQLEVLHTPGHLGNHIALIWNDAIFVGDLVMGWSTSLISPPDGDMTDFLASCGRLGERPSRIFYSGHGAPILNPRDRLSELVAHRDARSRAVLAALKNGPQSVSSLVDAIYLDIDPRLKPAAGRNVLAHLIDLYVQDRVTPMGDLGPNAQFKLS